MRIIFRLLAVLHLYILAVAACGYFKSQTPSTHRDTKPAIQKSITNLPGTQSRVTAQLSNFRPLNQSVAGASMVPAEALLKSRSPHALEDLINGANLNETRFIDFTSVWQKMQIEHDARGDFDRLTPSDNPWRARVFDAGTTQVPLRQVVLEVSAHGGASRRYLIFKQESSSYSGWLVLGNIDILGGRYEGSPHQQYHRVITTSGHTWLLLRAVASGTGTYDVKEMWYEIRGPRPEKVLEYSIEGWHASGDVSDRKFSSRLISEESSR